MIPLAEFFIIASLRVFIQEFMKPEPQLPALDIYHSTNTVILLHVRMLRLSIWPSVISVLPYSVPCLTFYMATLDSQFFLVADSTNIYRLTIICQNLWLCVRNMGQWVQDFGLGWRDRSPNRQLTREKTQSKSCLVFKACSHYFYSCKYPYSSTPLNVYIIILAICLYIASGCSKLFSISKCY